MQVQAVHIHHEHVDEVATLLVIPCCGTSLSRAASPRPRTRRRCCSSTTTARTASTRSPPRCAGLDSRHARPAPHAGGERLWLRPRRQGSNADLAASLARLEAVGLNGSVVATRTSTTRRARRRARAAELLNRVMGDPPACSRWRSRARARRAAAHARALRACVRRARARAFDASPRGRHDDGAAARPSLAAAAPQLAAVVGAAVGAAELLLRAIAPAGGPARRARRERAGAARRASRRGS